MGEAFSHTPTVARDIARDNRSVPSPDRQSLRVNERPKPGGGTKIVAWVRLWAVTGYKRTLAEGQLRRVANAKQGGAVSRVRSDIRGCFDLKATTSWDRITLAR